MWPAVAPNGDVFFGLVQLALGRASFRTSGCSSPSTAAIATCRCRTSAPISVRPKDPNASASCGRQALNGDIRNLSSPQIAIHADGLATAGYVLHAVYPYDSDEPGPTSPMSFTVSHSMAVPRGCRR